MTTRKVHRHGRNGETSSNRVTFSHVTAGKKLKRKNEKLERLKSPGVEESTQIVMHSMPRDLFSRKHVAVWKGFMTTQPHDVRLRLGRESSNLFIRKKDTSNHAIFLAFSPMDDGY